jgi:hypothetical protein
MQQFIDRSVKAKFCYHSSGSSRHQLCMITTYTPPPKSDCVPESLPHIESCIGCVSKRFQSSRWCLVSRPRTVRVQDESGNSVRERLVDKMLGQWILDNTDFDFSSSQPTKLPSWCPMDISKNLRLSRDMCVFFVHTSGDCKSSVSPNTKVCL